MEGLPHSELKATSVVGRDAQDEAGESGLSFSKPSGSGSWLPWSCLSDAVDELGPGWLGIPLGEESKMFMFIGKEPRGRMSPSGGGEVGLCAV